MTLLITDPVKATMLTAMTIPDISPVFMSVTSTLMVVTTIVAIIFIFGGRLVGDHLEYYLAHTRVGRWSFVTLLSVMIGILITSILFAEQNYTAITTNLSNDYSVDARPYSLDYLEVRDIPAEITVDGTTYEDGYYIRHDPATKQTELIASDDTVPSPEQLRQRLNDD